MKNIIFYLIFLITSCMNPEKLNDLPINVKVDTTFYQQYSSCNVLRITLGNNGYDALLFKAYKSNSYPFLLQEASSLMAYSKENGKAIYEKSIFLRHSDTSLSVKKGKSITFLYILPFVNNDTLYTKSSYSFEVDSAGIVWHNYLEIGWPLLYGTNISYNKPYYQYTRQ